MRNQGWVLRMCILRKFMMRALTANSIRRKRWDSAKKVKAEYTLKAEQRNWAAKLRLTSAEGLESRGHPIGASGLAQIHELVTQLRGNAGKRQIEGAKIGMAENGGGALGQEEAAMCIHILEAPSK